MSLDAIPEAMIGPWKALLLTLQGRTNQLAVWDMSRPAPRGTMRGSPSISAGGISAGATVWVLSTGVPFCTLFAGDLLGIGSGLTQQVVMVTEDVVADGAGNIRPYFQPALRNSFVNGTAVVWDRPKALFRLKETAFSLTYETVVSSGFVLDLLEDPRP